MMDNAAVDILIIALGLVLVFFPKVVAREGVRQNNRFSSGSLLLAGIKVESFAREHPLKQRF
jgi:hypothetical protein